MEAEKLVAEPRCHQGPFAELTGNRASRGQDVEALAHRRRGQEIKDKVRAAQRNCSGHVEDIVVAGRRIGPLEDVVAEIKARVADVRSGLRRMF